MPTLKNKLITGNNKLIGSSVKKISVFFFFFFVLVFVGPFVDGRFEIFNKFIFQNVNNVEHTFL